LGLVCCRWRSGRRCFRFNVSLLPLDLWSSPINADSGNPGNLG